MLAAGELTDCQTYDTNRMASFDSMRVSSESGKNSTIKRIPETIGSSAGAWDDIEKRPNASTVES